MLDDLRVPPQNVDAERALIGSLLLAPDLMDEVQVTVDDFYNDGHQIVYAAICNMWDRGIRAIDAVTIASELARRGELARAGGPSYIGEILEAVPHSAHAKHYERLVIECSRKRKIIYGCLEAMQEAYGQHVPSDEIVSNLDRLVLQMQDLVAKDLGTIDEAVSELEFEEANPASIFSTGLYDLDRKLAKGGFKSGQLIVIAARPGGGKSALAGQIARYNSQQKIPTLVVSLEMPKSEIAERFSTTVDRQSLRGLPIYFAESAFSMDRIRQVIRLAVRKHRVKIVVVDYLQLVQVTDLRKSRDLQIAEVSRGLKLLANELAMPIIVGCQLNRGSEKENRKPRLIDLRESGAIEQDADSVLMLHHDDNGSEIIIAKQRGGSTGSLGVVFDRMRTIFRDRDPSEGFKF